MLVNYKINITKKNKEKKITDMHNFVAREKFNELLIP